MSCGLPRKIIARGRSIAIVVVEGHHYRHNFGRDLVDVLSDFKIGCA
jgi:hypothetical protein